MPEYCKIDMSLDPWELLHMATRLRTVGEAAMKLAADDWTPSIQIDLDGISIHLPPLFPAHAEAAPEATPEPAPPPPPPSGGAADLQREGPALQVEAPASGRIEEFPIGWRADGSPVLVEPYPEKIEQPVLDLVDTPDQVKPIEFAISAVGDVTTAPVPGSASALAAEARPDAWTEAEDELTVVMAAKARLQGENWYRISQAITAKLPGRTAGAINFRMKNKLIDRIEASRQALAAALNDAGPAPDPTSIEEAIDPPAEPAPAAEPDPAAKAQAWNEGGANLPPVFQHLTSAKVAKDASWTVHQDAELFELLGQGWTLQDIANDMGRDSRAVKLRFDLLTGLEKGEDDKLRRRFAIAEVAAALRKMTAPKAAE